jgi:hypothetical protein
MHVTTPEKRWTDDRLDDLKETVEDGFARTDKKMDDGFARVDKKMDDGFARADKKMDDGFARADKKMDDGFARVDADIRELRSGVNGLRVEVDARFDKLNERFSRQNWGLFAAAVVIIGALLGPSAF